MLKTHGVKGEIVVEADDAAIFDTSYIIVPVNGLFVPFYVESHRGKSDSTDIIKLEDLDSDAAVAPLLGAKIYLKISDLDADDEFASLEGYRIFDSDHEIGVVTAVDDQTENVLFEVKTASGKVLIPAVDEWVKSIDDSNRIIVMNLPEGLVELNYS